MRRALTAGLLLAVLARQAAGSETGNATIVLLTMEACCSTEAWPEAEQRAAAELRALELRVIIEPSRARDDRARRLESRERAAHHQAAAVLRILHVGALQGGEAEIWLVDRLSNKMVQRSLRVDRRQPDASSVVGLRVVELLRASLLELNLPDRPTPSVPPRLRIATRAAREPAIGVRLALGALGSPGGASAEASVGLALRWSPRPYLSIELESDLGLFGAVEHSSGRATFGVASVRGWVLWEIWRRGRLRPAIGVGGGALIAWSSGLDSPLYNARGDTTVTAQLDGTAQTGIVLTQHLWLRLGLTVGLAVPQIAVRYPDQIAATFGRPLLAGWVGLEVRLP
jgi:hypothetical protein